MKRAPGGGGAARAVAELTPSTRALRHMIQAFREEMARGLSSQPSSLKMLPAFVDQPRGDERGPVAVVDWGGTHGRVEVIDLDGAGAYRVVAAERFEWSDADRAGPAQVVFERFAVALSRVLGELRPSGAVPLGFVYSYPARFERIDRAIALSLTKGWRLTGLVGNDAGGMLADAVAGAGLDPVRVTAVTNDTVAALALGSYRMRGHDRRARPADVGLIVGTGTNQAADLPGHGVRNLESGNFDKVAELATEWDAALDRDVADPAPGAQRFEKMAAGHYLGEIVRRVARDLAECSGALRAADNAFERPFGVESAHLSAIAADPSRDLAGADALLRAMGVATTRGQRHVLMSLADAVARRSARMIAAAVLGTVTFADQDAQRLHVVAVDGSLYGGFPGFPDMVRDGLAELAEPVAAGRIRLDYVRDSTSAGAAVIARAAWS